MAARDHPGHTRHDRLSPGRAGPPAAWPGRRRPAMPATSETNRSPVSRSRQGPLGSCSAVSPQPSRGQAGRQPGGHRDDAPAVEGDHVLGRRARDLHRLVPGEPLGVVPARAQHAGDDEQLRRAGLVDGRHLAGVQRGQQLAARARSRPDGGCPGRPGRSPTARCPGRRRGRRASSAAAASAPASSTSPAARCARRTRRSPPTSPGRRTRRRRARAAAPRTPGPGRSRWCDVPASRAAFST